MIIRAALLAVALMGTAAHAQTLRCDILDRQTGHIVPNLPPASFVLDQARRSATSPNGLTWQLQVEPGEYTIARPVVGQTDRVLMFVINRNTGFGRYWIVDPKTMQAPVPTPVMCQRPNRL